MQVIYAFRRATLYPYEVPPFHLPPPEARAAWLEKVRSVGFNGLELGLDLTHNSDWHNSVRALHQDLTACSLPCVAVRCGVCPTHPRQSGTAGALLEQAITTASLLGAQIVNVTLTHPVDNRLTGGLPWGNSELSQGASRSATEHDFLLTANVLRQAAHLAEQHHLRLAIEVHQHSLADNSWSTLHLLDLIDHPNVGVNPDLGNIYWQYADPEERPEQAIIRLAPRAAYWHCKNLLRLPLPQLNHAIYQRVPLPDGEIDYRFAISAMLAADYRGALAIEGLPLGDQLSADAKSLSYIHTLLNELKTKNLPQIQMQSQSWAKQ